MTTNVRFIPTNLADSTSSFTATSEAGSLVAANMQRDERAAVCRSTSLAAQTYDLRWATAQSIDSICGAWSNLTSGGTVQAKGYTNVGDGSTVFDETVAPDTGLNIGNTTFQNWIAAAYNIKQLKIVVTDAANPAGYVEISRLCVGKRIEPVRNAMQQAFRISLREQFEAKTAESGDLRAEPGWIKRILNMNFAMLEPASRDLMFDMVFASRGKGIFVSAFPENSTASTRQMHAFWGMLVKKQTDFGYPQYDTWSVEHQIEEMGPTL